MSKLKSIVSGLTGFTSVYDNLTFYIKDRVVVNSRNDSKDKSRVKLISGGGSGHEPAHIGYVGEGMLTASVCGELFSSPAVQHILNAILVCGTPDTSILLVIKNYTGDQLNFGLAMEIAKNRFNYSNIDMITINDDISIDDNKVHKSVGRRGLAGTIVYHIIIGALAAKHKKLDSIVHYINRLLTNDIICTVGFTFKANIPDGIRDIEIGKGIHGEPGVEFIAYQDDFDNICKLLLKKFTKKIPQTSNVIMLVNNLGGTSQMMMDIFLNEVYQQFAEVYRFVKIYNGCFLTSLNSEGISVTLVNLSDPNDLLAITGYLESDTSVPCNIFQMNIKTLKNTKSVIKNSIDLVHNTLGYNYNSKFSNDQYGTIFKNIIERCVHDILKNTELLNKIDSEFGDGDTGTTLACYANEIQLQLDSGVLNSFSNPKLIFVQLAEIAQTSVGGTTGALYCLFFEGLTSAIDEGATLNLALWATGVKAGIEAIMKYGHAEKGDRTLLDPLSACHEALENFTGFQNLSRICEEVVAVTKDLIPKSGRAAYTFSMDEHRKAVYPDPGAKAVGILVNAMNEEIGNFK